MSDRTTTTTTTESEPVSLTYEDRMARILHVPTDDELQPHALTGTSTQTHPLARMYYIGAPAKKALRARLPHPKLLSTYLNWLAIYNPTYAQWIDNRPEDLRQYDTLRLEQGLTPLWTYGLDAAQDTLSLVLTPETVTTYAQLALDMGIGQQQYVDRKGARPFEGIRSTPLDKLHLLSPGKRTGWFLRALGMNYLVPIRQPTPEELQAVAPWVSRKEAVHIYEK